MQFDMKVLKIYLQVMFMMLEKKSLKRHKFEKRRIFNPLYFGINLTNFSLKLSSKKTTYET
jgi:hypothetical protein